MNIFEKSLEIWKQIENLSCNLFEPSIIFDTELVGKENNCLSSIVKSAILLDGKLNQIHFLKTKTDDITHHVVLVTPQPIQKYSQISLSTTNQFLALIGIDTVGIIDISNVTVPQTCKKVKEVFRTEDEIISVQWYPKMQDCLVILCKQSVNIFQCRSDMRVVPCFQYHLAESASSFSNSFGIKEEFVNFDYGSSDVDNDDNKLFILTDSGDVLLIPELKKLASGEDIVPKKLSFYPPSKDNYQDDFTSLVVLRGSLDILVLVNCHGTVQHALIMNECIYVYETINVLSVSKDSESGPVIIADKAAYPPRYLLLHSTGIHSCILPWAVRLRLAVQGKSDKNFKIAFNEAGNSIIDNALDTASINRNKHTKNSIRGLVIVREAMKTPELCVLLHNNEKRLIKTKLRQESTLMLSNSDVNNREIATPGHEWPISKDSGDMFIKAILKELNKGTRIPYVASAISDKDDEGEAKLGLVLKISEKISSDFGTRLEQAGEIFDQRISQMQSIVKLQQDQVKNIVSSTQSCREAGKRLTNGFQAVSSRQMTLIKRISDCSNRLGMMYKTIPRADRESVNTISSVEKKLASMQALLRSCRVRLQDSESFIDQVKKKEDKFNDVSDDVKNRAHACLVDEDKDINDLVEEVRRLMN